jgi:hypothetical protein
MFFFPFIVAVIGSDIKEHLFLATDADAALKEGPFSNATDADAALKEGPRTSDDDCGRKSPPRCGRDCKRSGTQCVSK